MSRPSRQQCPICGRGPKDRTLEIWAEGQVHCHRGCDWRDIKDAVGHQYQPPVNNAPDVPKQRWSDKAKAIWRRSISLHGTPVARYLLGRGLPLPEHDVRAIQPDSERPHWRMLARITDAVTGEPLSLHFTHLCADGTRKKRYLPGHVKRGGVVRLFPDENIEARLGIAEGIESALAASSWQGPIVWVCLDAGNMEQFPVVDGIEALTIWSDNDEAGLRASRACKNRWVRADVAVDCLKWPEGTPNAWDAADELRESRHATAV